MIRLVSSLLASARKSPRAGNPSARRRRVLLRVESLDRRELLSGAPSPLSSVTIGEIGLPMKADAKDDELPLVYSDNFDTKQLPKTYPYYIQVDHEVMEITGPSNGLTIVDGGDNGLALTFPVDRAADGTTLVSHPANEPVLWLNGYMPATHLGAPTGFQAKTISSTEVDLSWNGLIGTNGFVIDQFDPSTGTWKDIKTVGGATMNYQVTNLSAGKTYQFEVRGFNDAGPGDFTNPLSVTTASASSRPTAPATPTNFTARAISTSDITLSWNGVSGATGYLVYQYNFTSRAWQKLTATTSTTYTVPHLAAGTSYTFDVAASNAAGSSQGAPPQSATTFKVAPPPLLDAPSSFGAKATSSSTVNLTWSAVAGASGYVVEQLKGSTWTAIIQLGSGSLSYPVPGLNAASTNTFKVAAINQAGIGKFTNALGALTLPAAPTNFTFKTVSPTQVTLSWNAVGGATGYTVEYQGSNGAWTVLKTLAVGQTSLSVTLSAGVAYSFAVGASNASGTTFANPITVKTQAAVPGIPGHFTVKQTSKTQVELVWDAVAGATSYVISYYANGAWKTITSTKNTYVYLTVATGSTYTFDVQAANASGTSQGAPPKTITIS